MNASSPTKARSPTASVAQGSRRPPPPTRTSRPKYPFAPMNTRRHCTSSRGPKLVSAPTANTSSHWTKPSSPISTPSSSTIRGATTIVPLAEPHAFADRRAGTAVRVAALVRGERPEGVRVGPQRLEEALVQPALGLRQLEHGGQADALERDAGEEPRRRRPRPPPPARRRARSTSSAVMKPSFSIDAEVDAVLLGQLDRPPRRVRGPGRLRRRSLRGLRLVGGGELGLALGDDARCGCPARPLHPARRGA